MSDSIPQTSASGRYETARNALAAYDALANIQNGDRDSELLDLALDCVRALEALITPPGTPLTQASIDHAADIAETHGYDSNGVTEAVLEGIEYGIQYAHERWEPADVPSQEFMLRHLGLRYGPAGRPTHIHIPFQNIEKEN